VIVPVTVAVAMIVTMAVTAVAPGRRRRAWLSVIARGATMRGGETCDGKAQRGHRADEGCPALHTYLRL